MASVFTYCCKHSSVSEMIPREQIRACFRMIASFFTVVIYRANWVWSCTWNYWVWFLCMWYTFMIVSQQICCRFGLMLSLLQVVAFLKSFCTCRFLAMYVTRKIFHTNLFFFLCMQIKCNKVCYCYTLSLSFVTPIIMRTYFGILPTFSGYLLGQLPQNPVTKEAKEKLSL